MQPTSQEVSFPPPSAEAVNCQEFLRWGMRLVLKHLQGGGKDGTLHCSSQQACSNFGTKMNILRNRRPIPIKVRNRDAARWGHAVMCEAERRDSVVQGCLDFMRPCLKIIVTPAEIKKKKSAKIINKTLAEGTQ